MAEVNNLGHAAMIIACIYFLINGNLGIWGKFGLMAVLLFALATWGVWTNPYQKEAKELMKKKLEVEEARRINFNTGSQMMVIQAKLLAQGLKQ